MGDSQGIKDFPKDNLNLASTLLKLDDNLSDNDADLLWNAFEDCIKLNASDMCKKLLTKFKPRSPDNVLLKKILEARLAILNNDTSTAVRSLEDAIRIRVSNTSRGLRLKSYAYLLLGNIFSNNNQRTRAIEAYNKGLGIINSALRISRRRDLPSWSIRGELLLRLGQELMKFNDRRRAMQALFDALRSYNEAIRLTRGRNIEILEQKASVLIELAKLMQYLNDFDSAIEFLSDAAKLYERVIMRTNYANKELWLKRASILKELAKMLFAVGDHYLAFYVFSDAIISLKNASSQSEELSLESLKILLEIAANLADLSFEVGAYKTQIRFEVMVIYLAKIILSKNPKDSDVMLIKADFLVKLILSLTKTKTEALDYLVCEAIDTLKELRKKMRNDLEIRRRIMFLENLAKKRKISCKK